MTRSASPSSGQPELGRHAGDRALGEGRSLGRERPLDVRRDVGSSRAMRRRSPPRLDDRVRVVDVDVRGAERERIVGREPQDRDVVARASARASRAAGSATTRSPRSGSSARTMALRVVERGRRDDRLAAVDLDAVAERASGAASRASAPCRAAGRSSSPSRCRRSRHRPQIGEPSVGAGAVHREARSSAGGRRASPVRSSAARPMNARLLHPDRPVHPDAARRRVELGVHPDDDVALLEPQPEQRLEAVRPDAEVARRGP